MTLRTLSLFSGGCGLDLGLGEAGFAPVCFVESDPDCLRLIRARSPGVPVVEDVRAVDAELEAVLGEVEVVAGGFPCQDPTDEKARLSPWFVEWMLGYPPGWTDLDGSRGRRGSASSGTASRCRSATAPGWRFSRSTASWPGSSPPPR